MNNDTAFMILLISLVILCGLFVIGVAVQVTGDETRDNLCKKICERKNCDFVETSFFDCKCLNKLGDVEHFRK